MRDWYEDTAVTIVTGGLASSGARISDDLRAVLDDDDLRILTVLGHDGFHVVSSQLHLAGVDVALVHQDVLEALRRDGIFPDMGGRLRYIVMLHRDPVFILARPEIENIGDLKGKTVNLGRGSEPLKQKNGEIWGKTVDLGSGLAALQTTQALVLDAIGLDVKPAFLDLGSALAAMRDGSIEATVLVGPELVALASRLRPDDKLRVIQIDEDDQPKRPALTDVYEPAVISGGDYEGILPPGAQITTISVPLVMITSDWSYDHVRYAKIERFTQAMFDNFASLLEEGRAPAWKAVDIAAPLEGWTRFRAAEEWLAANATETAYTTEHLRQLQRELEEFLATRDIR